METVGPGTTVIGPLAAISVFASRCRLRPTRIWVDNAGSVGIWSKGHSNYCRLCTNIVKVISVVAAGLGCQVEIMQIARCSTEETLMADQISKGEFRECFETGRRMHGEDHGGNTDGHPQGPHGVGGPPKPGRQSGAQAPPPPGRQWGASAGLR